MRAIARCLLACGLLVAPRVGSAAPAVAQVELDRILVRVNGRLITSSDVQQARRLQLVDDVATDETTMVALERRLLILDEIARTARAAPQLPITDEDVAALRAAWETRLGGPAKATALLAETGMTDAGLETWLRDDVRIREYLDRQFGALPATSRERATADLLVRLRARAGLK